MSVEKNALTQERKTQKIIKLVPPDGGWGWLVVIGTALCNIFNQSMLSLFTLLYGDTLEAMGHNTQGAAVVLSTMLFVTNFSGPIAGAIVKLTSTRIVAVTGACSCTLGILLSGFSTNIWHLIMTYGILLGFGLGFIQNSSFVAINSYFKLKKSRAVGLANVGTGVGQTLMPHLVRYLLENYGFRGACLLLSSLSLHGICGTLLIQPVEWHMKKVEEEVVVDEKLHLLQDGRKLSTSNGDARRLEKRLSDTNIEIKLSNKSFNGGQITTDRNGHSCHDIDIKPEGGPMKQLHKLFGISLLSDARFLNIVIGTALCVTSIQNFSMLFPFFLQKVAGMNKQQTANCMSAVASADIAGRIILPMIQDKFRIKARWMLIMTSIWVIFIRQIMAYQSDMNVLLVMSCFYGVGRSMMIVARNIAISEHVRLDQVPAAVGLGMLTMGVIVPPAGYFLGWIRDYTGSFIICIYAQNALLVVLLITWIPDMLYLWLRDKREKQKDMNKDML